MVIIFELISHSHWIVYIIYLVLEFQKAFGKVPNQRLKIEAPWHMVHGQSNKNS